VRAHGRGSTCAWGVDGKAEGRRAGGRAGERAGVCGGFEPWRSQALKQKEELFARDLEAENAANAAAAQLIGCVRGDMPSAAAPSSAPHHPPPPQIRAHASRVALPPLRISASCFVEPSCPRSLSSHLVHVLAVSSVPPPSASTGQSLQAVIPRHRVSEHG
jgi:hypothetical protein